MTTALTTDVAASIPVAADPRLARGVREFLSRLNASGAPPLETLSPMEARWALADAQAAVKVDLSGIEESEREIVANGYHLKLNIVRPAGVADKLPVFVFLHGGGWVLGDYPTHRRMVRDLVVLSGCCAVFVNYTPAPDAVFPEQLHEVYAATKWVADYGSEINVDGAKLAVVGNSTGGNLTAVTALKAKEIGAPKIKLLVMMWPVTDADLDTRSYRHFGQDRFLTRSLMQWMFDLYIPNAEQRKDIYAAPLQATIEQLRDLPPTLIQVAENDILRDEGEAFGRRLDQAGVDVTTIRYDGMIHDFGLLNDLAHLPQVRSLFMHAAAELRKRLN